MVGNTRCFALPDEVEGKPEVGSVVTIENLEAGGGGRALAKVVGHISDLAKPVIEVIADHPFLRYVPNTCVIGFDQNHTRGISVPHRDSCRGHRQGRERRPR